MIEQQTSIANDALSLDEHKHRSKAACRLCADQAARMDFIVTCAEALFGGAMGWMTGSIGLHAMALLLGGDIISKGINWFSIHFSRRAPTKRFPYGYGKLQFLSAFLIGLLLAVGSLSFLWHNVQHINTGHVEQPGVIAILAAMVLAVSGELMHRYLICTDQHNNNPAIRAAAMDSRVDAITSLMVLVGAVISYFGFREADHLMALGVALVVVKMGGEIMVDAVQGLLDIGLPPNIYQQAKTITLSLEQVESVKKLRGRRLGDAYHIEVELCLPGNIALAEAHQLRKRLQAEIIQQVQHVQEVQVSLSINESIPNPVTGEG